MVHVCRLSLALGLLLLISVVHAKPPSEDTWTFTVGFYGWLAGFDGTVAAFGAPAADTSASLGDVLDRTEGALMGFAEARKGRFMLGADVLGAKLSQDEDAALGSVATGVKVTTENWMLTGVAGYSVVAKPGAILDVVGGARFWSVDNEIEFRGGTLNGRSVSDGETWTDPLVGLRGQLDLSEKFYVTGWALIGGFGAGSDSMWDLMAALGYRFSKRFSALAGYRALSVDYEKGAFLYDVEQSGVMLGGIFRF